MFAFNIGRREPSSSLSSLYSSKNLVKQVRNWKKYEMFEGNRGVTSMDKLIQFIMPPVVNVKFLNIFVNFG